MTPLIDVFTFENSSFKIQIIPRYIGAFDGRLVRFLNTFIKSIYKKCFNKPDDQTFSGDESPEFQRE